VGFRNIETMFLLSICEKLYYIYHISFFLTIPHTLRTTNPHKKRNIFAKCEIETVITVIKLLSQNIAE